MRTNSFRVTFEGQNSLKRMCKMATEEPQTEPTVEQLILTEGIDFAVPPSANEQQIEHTIQNALDEDVDVTLAKVNKLWEKVFNIPAPDDVILVVKKESNLLKEAAGALQLNPKSAPRRSPGVL